MNKELYMFWGRIINVYNYRFENSLSIYVNIFNNFENSGNFYL